jgi:NADH-quinone oxidoreductase subunit G
MKVTIDGQEIEVEAGTTICKQHVLVVNPYLQPMCYYSKLEGSGGKCRCLVEVAKGSEADPRMPKLMASCVTGCMDGWKSTANLLKE